MPTDREICEYIFGLAKSKHISQVAIAKACDVSRAAVNNWKSDGFVPTDNHRPIAELLGTTVDGLLSLGRYAPVISLTQDQLDRLPSETKELILQAMQIIDTALKNSKPSRGGRAGGM